MTFYLVEMDLPYWDIIDFDDNYEELEYPLDDGQDILDDQEVIELQTKYPQIRYEN